MFQDPLKKREQFAVSLRKKKSHDIINAKRRRLFKDLYQDEGPVQQDGAQVQSNYKGFPKYEQNQDEYNTALAAICPEYFSDRTLSVVRITKKSSLINGL